MNLYAWIDENGRWRVAHRPPLPELGDAVLMIALPPEIIPTFIDWSQTVEVEIKI